jgi:hypothetical protein
MDAETIAVRSTRDCDTLSSSSWNTDLMRAMAVTYVEVMNSGPWLGEQKVNWGFGAIE